MTNPSTPADDILAAMYNQANERLGHIIHAAMRAVFAADGFRWNRADTRQAIADAIRQIPDDADLADGITQVICTVYAGHGHPHDPDTVRQVVARQLGDARPHGDQPGAQTSW